MGMVRPACLNFFFFLMFLFNNALNTFLINDYINVENI